MSHCQTSSPEATGVFFNIIHRWMNKYLIDPEGNNTDNLTSDVSVNNLKIKLKCINY